MGDWEADQLEAALNQAEARLAAAEARAQKAEAEAHDWKVEAEIAAEDMVALHARAQKAEAVVEAARRIDADIETNSEAGSPQYLINALTAYDEPPTERA